MAWAGSRRRRASWMRSRARLLGAITTAFVAATPAIADRFFGTVTAAATGRPVAGAMVTFGHGDPGHSITVFTDDQGRYVSPALAHAENYRLRVRRIGWDDARRGDLAPSLVEAQDFALARTADPVDVAYQLPANVWYDRVLARIDDPGERAELKQQCTC